MDKEQARNIATSDGVISIFGECGEFSIDEAVWRAWLTLARLHGWEPAGTEPPVMDPDTGRELDARERRSWEEVGNDGGYGPPYKRQIHTRPGPLTPAHALPPAAPR